MLGHIKLFTLLATTGFVAAQSLSLSTNCTDALEGLLTSPDAACLNPTALSQLVLGTQDVVTTTIDNWLTGLCAQGSCSDASLQAIVTNITTGCAADLSSLGISSDISSDVLTIVEEIYPTVRQIGCLKDDSTNQLCVTQTLTNLQTVIGTLSTSDLSFFNLLEDAQKLISSGISKIACTGCIQEAFSIAQENFGDVVSQLDSDATALCGANFTSSGNVTEGISETAVGGVFSATSSNDQNSASSRTLRLGSLLGVVAWVFLLLV